MSRGTLANGRKPLLVELVGAAGVGKSTMAHELAERMPGVRAGLTVWGLPRRFLLAGAFDLLVPFLAAQRRRDSQSAAELSHMVRLGALRRSIERMDVARHCHFVLDEGPVFALATLAFRFERNGSGPWAQWRRETVAAWARNLDAIVHLDAADPVIAHRIRTRSTPHTVKYRPEAEIRAFVAGFRRAYERVIRELEAAGPVTVIALRTDDAGVSELAGRLHEALEELRHAR